MVLIVVAGLVYQHLAASDLWWSGTSHSCQRVNVTDNTGWGVTSTAGKEITVNTGAVLYTLKST